MQLEALKEVMRTMAAEKDQSVADATAPLLQKLQDSEAAVSAAQQVRACCSLAARFHHSKFACQPL